MDQAKDHKSNINQYAYALASQGCGTFLYHPAPSETCHPGSVGYFDGQGKWNQIADVSKQEQEEPFQPFNGKLKLKPTETQSWKTMSGDTSSGSSMHGGAGVSDLVTTLGEAEAHAGYSKSSSQTAALITLNKVKLNSYHSMFKPNVSVWVKDNAKRLMTYMYASEIKEYGLWAIRETYVADDYASKMSSSNDSSIKGGLDLAAKGVGKIDAGAETFKKLSNEGWRTAKAEPGSEGWTVSFSGIYYKPGSWIHKRSLKEQTDTRYALLMSSDSEPTFRANPPIPFGDQVGDEHDKEIVGGSTPMSQEDIEELKKYQSELEGQLIALKDLYDHGESDRKELMSDLDAIEEKVSRRSTFIGTTEQRQKQEEEESREKAAAFEEGKALCEVINGHVEKMNEIVKKAYALREELQSM